MTTTGASGSDPAVVRVLVAEDQQLVRAGIVTMLSADARFAVVAEAADGQAAVLESRRTRPDVALLDLRMPIMDGIQATRRITAELPATRVLALTTFGTDDNVFAALNAGASGFLLKDTRPEDLLEAVYAVAGGQGRLDPAVTALVVSHFRTHAAPSGIARTPAPLTEREVDVLRLMARGFSNAEIAAELHIAPGTVKTHVANVLAKLGARDRVQAVIAAYESRLVQP